MIARIFTHLFAYVFGLLSQTGPKVLTADSLRSELNAPSVSEGDLLTAEWLLRRLDEIEGRLTVLEETVNRHLSEEHPKTFLKLPLPVASKELARCSTSTRSSRQASSPPGPRSTARYAGGSHRCPFWPRRHRQDQVAAGLVGGKDDLEGPLDK